MPKTAILVPARLASTRFPRKLLHPVRGKPILLWVAERIASQTPELPLWFAVDDQELADVLQTAGFNWVMTSTDHQSGTDRLAEANKQVGADYVINVQADEPLVTAGQLRMLADLIQGDCPMATLGVRFSRPDDFFNPNQVKVVVDSGGRALYFSRSPIPYARDLAGKVDAAWIAENAVYRHLGLYAYRAEFLRRFASLPMGRLERIERLEQLRVLENGEPIAVGITAEASIGIDTEEDARAFAEHLDATLT